MSLRILHPEVFGVDESSLSVAYGVGDDTGEVDAPAEIWLDGQLRAADSGGGPTRQLRIEGLQPGTEYSIEIRTTCGARSEADAYLPDRVRTLDAPGAEQIASLATMNDLHFGEPEVGGALKEGGESTGEESEGFPLIRDSDTETPYWRFMNEDAVAEINQAEVDCAVIKGDIADAGQTWQFEEAARVFSHFERPHHVFLGNHDHLETQDGVDGYSLLDQPPAPRSLDLEAWRLVFLETSLPGVHRGVFSSDRLEWLSDTLSDADAAQRSTLVFMHHHPVPPEHAHRFPNRIGIEPEHSTQLIDLIGAHPQVRGVLIGHTHRNRVRRHPGSGDTPYVEVHSTKDYPGGWAHYRLFEDASFRQEVRRTASDRALRHSSRCRQMYQGHYRVFALGSLEERSFEITATPSG